MAGSAGAFWQLEYSAYTFQPVGGNGVWADVFKQLANEADNEYAMIDSTIVRAHQHSAGAKKKTVRIKPSDEARAD